MADDAERRDLAKKAGYGSATTAPGDLTSPTRRTPPPVGPDSPFRQGKLKDSWRPGLATGWGPYFDAMFPPARVTAWINFKRMSTGVNIARRLWDQREGLRQGYEALHGTDHSRWPAQHPGIVLDAVQWVAHLACLACHWIHHGVSMRETGWYGHAAELALRHQNSDGAQKPHRCNGSCSGTLIPTNNRQSWPIMPRRSRSSRSEVRL